MATYYLNNTGHRWVNRDENNRNERISFEWEGVRIVRRVKFYEAMGNFAVANVTIGGKVRIVTDYEPAD